MTNSKILTIRRWEHGIAQSYTCQFNAI